MTSLPEEFEHDDDDTVPAKKARLQDKPIDFGEHERMVPANHRPAKKSGGIALPIAMLSLVISAIVLSVAVEHPLQKISAMFGGQKMTSSSVDAQVMGQLESLSLAVKEATQKADQAVNGLRVVTQDIDGIRTQLSDVDARQTNLENRVIQIHSKLDAMTARPVPKPVVAKPKVAAVAPVLVSVVSIRHQGGIAWTSLREGLDTSPLLTVGDEWRNFKVVSIDTASHGVQVASNGNVTTVRL